MQLPKYINSSKISAISPANLSKIKVPVPPMEIQKEIVNILDQFIELEEELEAELEARFKQRNHVINQLHQGNLPELNGVIQVPLSQIVNFENGKPHEPLVNPEGDCELITSKFISSNGTLARRINFQDIRTLALIDDITIVLSDLPNGRALAKCYFVTKDNYFAVNQRIAILRSIDTSIADPEYLYHFVNRNRQILKFDNGSTQTHLKKANVVDMIVFLPDLKVQSEIAKSLTSLEKFVYSVSSGLPAEIKARRQQYEYYRNKLLTFKQLDDA
jgi:type I restriction enzyme S subunit